jgi:hypothetical protein
MESYGVSLRGHLYIVANHYTNQTLYCLCSSAAQAMVRHIDEHNVDCHRCVNLSLAWAAPFALCKNVGFSTRFSNSFLMQSARNLSICNYTIGSGALRIVSLMTASPRPRQSPRSLW